jgi:hypothetical protein
VDVRDDNCHRANPRRVLAWTTSTTSAASAAQWMNASWRGLLTGVNAFCSGAFTVSDAGVASVHVAVQRDPQRSGGRRRRVPPLPRHGAARGDR